MRFLVHTWNRQLGTGEKKLFMVNEEDAKCIRSAITSAITLLAFNVMAVECHLLSNAILMARIG